MKAIIFDVDGVVFKTHDTDGTFLWSRHAKKDLGLSKSHFDKIFSVEWIDLIKGKIDTVKYLQNIFRGDIFKELNLTPEVYIKYWLTNDSHINWDVLELIKHLKLPSYLGTNQESHRTNHIMESVGNYFAGCFASYQIGSIKPELAFFDHIQNTLNLAPSDLLLIDDTAENIQGARECGWNAYHYRNDLESLKIFINDIVDG